MNDTFDELESIAMQDIQIKDPHIERELETNGYVVVRGTTCGLTTRLHALYREVKAAGASKLNYNTGSDLQGPIRDRVFEITEKTFAPVLDRYFANHEIIAGMMFVKRPSAHCKGQVGLHFDPTLLPDETKQKHINIWSPLVDVNEANGALCLVPCSHRMFAPVHAVTIPPPFLKITDTVLQYGKCIRMEAGDVLMFDNRILHYSLQNFSNADRPAIVLSIVPSQVDLVSLFKPRGVESAIEVYQQPRSWYRDTAWIDAWERPKTGKFMGHLQYDPRLLSKEEFVERMEWRKSGIEYSFELKAGSGAADTHRGMPYHPSGQ